MDSLPTHSHPPLASLVPAPPLRMSVPDCLVFLKRDNDFAKRVLEKEAEAEKQVVQTINALIIVGAFIAGVQAQVAASTYLKNDTQLQIAANGFAFVGLALDVLGTSFGVLHALELQRSIRRTPELLHTRSKGQLKDLISELIRRKTDRQAIVGTLELAISERKKFWMIRRHSVAAPAGEAFRKHLECLFHEDQSTTLPLLVRLFSAAGVEQSTASLGTDPMLAMGAGIACLLISVICFVAYSQPRKVALACVSITVIVASSMMCGLFIHYDVAGKGRLFGELNVSVHLDSSASEFDPDTLENALVSIP